MDAKKVSYPLVSWLVLCMLSAGWSQQMSTFDRDRAQTMLRVIAGDVRKHYYDPKMHGLDWDAKETETKQKIEKAQSFNMALSHIAALLDALGDSHTFFFPPSHAYWHDYGWQFQMIGRHCYITRVRPQSDAEAKGLKAGDEVLAINGYVPDRDNLWKMEYTYNLLRPQAGLRVDLKAPAGNERRVDVMAKIRYSKRITDVTGSNGGNDLWDLIREEEGAEHRRRARMVDVGDDLMILRLPVFAFSESEIDKLIDRARKHKALIVDLRENPGGSVETLKFLVGGFFEREVKLCDRVGKKESKPMLAESRHNPFTGKLIVLVDSRSASASEVFARVVQLEKRGIVIGDISSGSVMESKQYEEKSGTDTVAFYGASITDADLIMTDGKSLEHSGVVPDERALPTASDLASGRDPVLAHAAETLGFKMSAEEAGKMFPYEWPPEK